MILNDRQIREMAEKHGMIDPFHQGLVSSTDAGPVISFGLSSFGYDIRLSPEDFRIFRHLPGQVVDPKNFNPNHVEKAELMEDQNGEYFILPGNSYGLGVAIEKLNVPENTSVLAIGKSTYARSGLIAALTPAEPGWRGHLTLEFSNSSPADCRIYANEGVVQLLFLRGESAGTCYNARNGKYQDQKLEVTLPRVLGRLALRAERARTVRTHNHLLP
jgi:dCTP deaminase